jgi:hypothetical protein
MKSIKRLIKLLADRELDRFSKAEFRTFSKFFALLIGGLVAIVAKFRMRNGEPAA